MESFTAEFVVQRTALAGSSSSSHSEARNAYFGFSHLFAELGVPGQRGKSMGQACGAQNWTKFAIHQVSDERHSGVLKSFPLWGGRLNKPTAPGAWSRDSRPAQPGTLNLGWSSELPELHDTRLVQTVVTKSALDHPSP